MRSVVLVEGVSDQLALETLARRCRRDLGAEDRALGIEDVEAVLSERNELGVFRSFRQQPAWRGREPEDQLRRFIGTYSGRKIEIARMLVKALDLNRVPRPLDGVLAYVS